MYLLFQNLDSLRRYVINERFLTTIDCPNRITALVEPSDEMLSWLSAIRTFFEIEIACFE